MQAAESTAAFRPHAGGSHAPSPGRLRPRATPAGRRPALHQALLTLVLREQSSDSARRLASPETPPQTDDPPGRLSHAPAPKAENNRDTTRALGDSSHHGSSSKTGLLPQTPPRARRAL